MKSSTILWLFGCIFQALFVPSYVPPPIEIPDNVANARYLVRLGFVRRVLDGFAGSVAFLFGISRLRIDLPIVFTVSATLGLLMVMSLVRRLAKGRRMDLVVSAGMLAPFLVSAGLMLRSLENVGLPMWPFAASVGFVWLYGFLCGRDLSFIAMFALPSVATILLWSLADGFGLVLGANRFLSPVLGVVFIFYIVYDLSALLTRRRLGEEIGAVADLYRDILNFTTYWARVRSHWRRHPIWQR